MILVETTSNLENIRKKYIISEIRDRILFLDYYNKELTIVPLFQSSSREIHIKVTDITSLKKLRKTTFVNVKKILGIIRYSLVDNRNLKWRQTKKKTGKTVCKDSPNLISSTEVSRVLTNNRETPRNIQR